MTQAQTSGGVQPALASRYAAQHYNADGKEIKLRDARGVEFEPRTSYVDHYPEKVAPVGLFVSAPVCLMRMPVAG